MSANRLKSRAERCRIVADNVNDAYEHEQRIRTIANNFCSLCEVHSQKGQYGLYLPNRNCCQLSYEDYEFLVSLIREEGFEANYDEEAESYYVSWRYA